MYFGNTVKKKFPLILLPRGNTSLNRLKLSFNFFLNWRCVCLIGRCLTSRSRIFHLYEDVTIDGEAWGKIYAHVRHLMSWRGLDLHRATLVMSFDLGFCECHTSFDTRPRFLRCHSNSNPDDQEKTCIVNFVKETLYVILTQKIHSIPLWRTRIWARYSLKILSKLSERFSSILTSIVW